MILCLESFGTYICLTLHVETITYYSYYHCFHVELQYILNYTIILNNNVIFITISVFFLKSFKIPLLSKASL